MESITFEKSFPFGPPISAEFSLVSVFDGHGPRQGSSMSSKIQIIFSRSVDMSKWGSRLDQMERLEEGWNGYQAPAPSRAAIKTARGFLHSLDSETPEPSRVAPSAVGGVGVTHKKNRRRVYVEFYNEGMVCAFFPTASRHRRASKLDLTLSTFER